MMSIDTNKEPAFFDSPSERREYRQKALALVAVNRLKEAEEERNYLVRYVKDPEDPTLWRRVRVRKLTPAEKRKLAQNPKPKLL